LRRLGGLWGRVLPTVRHPRRRIRGYKTKTEVAQIPVGDHPQRMRIGNVTRAWLQARQ